MQFLIIAYDGKDPEAPNRRKAVREQHLEGVKKIIAEKKLLYGGAILDENGAMIGSMTLADFPSREAMQKEWLDNEIYITGGVWQEIEIQPFRVAEVFHD